MTELSLEERFGQQVRDLRRTRGWSQMDLAVRMTNAGFVLHQAQISKMELGCRPIRLDEADAIARLLGVHLRALLDPEVTEDPWGDGYVAGFRDGESACASRVRAALSPDATASSVEQDDQEAGRG